MRIKIGGETGAGRSLGEEVRKAVGAVGHVLDEAAGAIDKALSDVGRAVRRRAQVASRRSVVVFEVLAPTSWGETVWIVGDHPALGQWEPTRAVPLAPAEYPVWSASIAIEPAARIHYKYLRKGADGSYAWEAFAENRALTVSPVAGKTRQKDEVSWT